MKPWIEYQRRELLFRESILAFFGVGKEETEKDSSIGGYCKGECVEECSKMFGPALEQVCKTCPN